MELAASEELGEGVDLKGDPEERDNSSQYAKEEERPFIPDQTHVRMG